MPIEQLLLEGEKAKRTVKQHMCNPAQPPPPSHQSLLVKSIPSRMFSSVSCLPLVYTTTMYRTRSDHALSSRTAWMGGRRVDAELITATTQT